MNNGQAVTKPAMNQLTKVIGIIALLAVVLMSAPQAMGASNSTLGTSTYYVQALSIRHKIVTTKHAGKATTGSKTTVLTASNKTSSKQKFGYKLTTTATGSVTLGASVPVKAINLEAGVTVSYSRQVTVSASITVPAHKTYHVYRATRTVTTPFTSVVQLQQWIFTWINIGYSYNVTSTWHQKSPVLTMQ